jgi:hypothetical protein
MEMWNLENHTIEGKYHGVPFRGTVISSRVCYGSQAAIEHTVVLEKAIVVYDVPRGVLTLKTSDAPDVSDYVVVE